ncbi:MAG: dephospho-CoA kinase [Cryomorphaceae bacterium]|nr:MAG: dephospho-CoA kinase [Cryomorphaceae bacterium]
MKLVGITGGIGSGKSTVARLIRAMGYPVYDADARARRLQETDAELIEAIVSLLGEEVLDEAGLNRAAIADKVFGNAELLAKLNDVVHPRVQTDFENWLKEQNSEICFKESALLVETGSWKHCDALIVVTAPAELRIKRVVQRDGTSEKAVKKRMEKQLPESEKVKRAGFVVVNDDHELLIPQVEAIINQLEG